MEPDLKLPTFAIPYKDPKVLSMDEYLDFVEFCLKSVIDLDVQRDLKRRNDCNIPFKLHGDD